LHQIYKILIRVYFFKKNFRAPAKEHEVKNDQELAIMFLTYGSNFVMPIDLNNGNINPVFSLHEVSNENLYVFPVFLSILSSSFNPISN
jgi:hypothetical protein